MNIKTAAAAMAGVILLMSACGQAGSGIEQGGQSSSESSGSVTQTASGGIAVPTYPDGGGSFLTDGNTLESLTAFTAESTGVMIDPTENGVYSPASLYMALAMLSECAGGATKTEIVDALSYAGNDLSTGVKSLFESLYFNNDTGRLLIANSIWLNKSMSYKPELPALLAREYYASVYAVDMGTDAAAKQMSSWVEDNTKGLLGGDPKDFTSSEYEVLRLINAIYFKDRWNTQFEKDFTQTGSFTTAKGGVVEAQYMKNSIYSGYVETENYLASSLGFSNGGGMTFILPSKALGVGGLLGDAGLMTEALNAMQSDKLDSAWINYAVPRFSCKGNMDLVDAMKKLGINMAFDEDAADFSPLTELDGVYVSGAKQEAVITVDESGVEAAAYTMISMETATAAPDKTVDFTLDRPFIFVVTGKNGEPVFIGVLADPSAE